jgi:uncharacterized protein YyaL (SSP411 family)
VNRLQKEASPYLRQHAGNPVDWYPWGAEALTKARAQDKPILLSIGYSACHWCHVMERESFEDPGMAAFMNEGFVCIKVDREERPDLDGIYMRAVQSLTGRGGWPLTAFLTPEGKTFFGGTYFPPTPRQGMPAFRQVMEAVLDAWRNRREEVERGAGQLLSVLRQEPDKGSPLERNQVLAQAYRSLREQFDDRLGGFGPPPKFPQPTTLEFLLGYHHLTGEDQALEMVLATLRAMGRGGMRDQLGGGFHRYSVDARWLVPHFEKMLYDNGLLARVYLHAFLLSGEEEFRDVAVSTLDYLLEDLRRPEGGFYSARDADSEGEEGLFYLWTRKELEEILDPPAAELVGEVYGVTPGGNFEGRSILHLPRGLPEVAESMGLELPALKSRLREAQRLLLAARERREAPFRDEKVLTSWNSFTLRALAEAGAALGEARFMEAARANATFLLENLREDDRILRSWKDGPGSIPGFLEDYAGLGTALLALHEATLETRWLEEAQWVLERTKALFWDEKEEVFYDTPVDGEPLVLRPRDLPDAATPSGNSLGVEFFQWAGILFGDEESRRIAKHSLEREAGSMARFPSAFGRLLSILVREGLPPLEVVILGDPEEKDTRALLRKAHRRFLPNRVILGGAVEDLPPLPLLEGRERKGGRATAYVCRDFTCGPPVQDPEALARELAVGPPREG